MNTSISPTRFRDLAYVRHGSGRPVIALHGYGATSYSWRHLAAACPAGIALYLFDLRGFGAAHKPFDERYALADQAAQICAFVNAEDLRDVTLIGHSMGGGVALLAAFELMAQGRLRSLVLVGSVAFPQETPLFLRLAGTPVLGPLALACLPPRLLVKFVLRQAYYDPEKIEDAAVATYAGNLASAEGRHALHQAARHMIPADLDAIVARYKDIAVPTLIVWGRNDEIIPFANGTRLHATIPASRLFTVDACGHIPQEEKPRETIPVITAFLAQGLDADVPD
jgi:pimeloyl-ACP methyl ester carboxylesterase